MTFTARVVAIGVAWLALAVIAGRLGFVARLRPPLPQLILLGMTVVLLLLGTKLQSFRSWLLSIDLRAVVALHLTRILAGSPFLFYHTRGELPTTFALPAGWGDIVVGTLALVVLLIPPSHTAAGRSYLIWNVIGLLDILMVVASAAVHAMRVPESVAALLRLPLSVLPTWLVPLVIASHVLVFVRVFSPPLRSSPFGRTPS